MKYIDDLSKYEKEFYKSNQPEVYNNIIFTPVGKSSITMSIISLYKPIKVLGKQTNLWNK